MLGLTQSELAQRVGTSQPTLAAYESGTKSPTHRTFERIISAVGMEAVIEFVPKLTREDRRSLALHRAIALRLLEKPAQTIAKARSNLERMRSQNPHADGLLVWDRLLDLTPERLAATLVDPAPDARELRQVTPFAGVLSPEERTTVYQRFSAEAP